MEHHDEARVHPRIRVPERTGLARSRIGRLVRVGDSWPGLPAGHSLDTLLRMPAREMRELLESLAVPPDLALGPQLHAPIESQEVWAAGVTYRRSLEARADEAISRDPYDRVYAAERPELFFKATPNRVRGPGEDLFIRSDSTWDVPEPELAVVCNSRLEVVGYTIGNDMSSRSIEGENSLYLPQAKVYDGCCALGPYITPAWEFDPAERRIELEISRDGARVFQAATSTSEMRRSIPELASFLGRDQRFDAGCILLTGTGVVPPADFTLREGDVVTIRIDGLGELTNPVRRHLP
jgi:2-dehydro-3-deoxy-D-arabinonate dehydratase